MFGTAVTFGTLTLVTLFLHTIITGKFWYIWCSLVHVTLGTPVGIQTGIGIFVMILYCKTKHQCTVTAKRAEFI